MKTASYSKNMAIFDNRHEYSDALLETYFDIPKLLDSVVRAMGDDEAKANFDYIDIM